MPSEEVSEWVYHLCLGCGKLRTEDAFEEGHTRCNDCEEKMDTDRFRPVRDGDGYRHVGSDSE